MIRYMKNINRDYLVTVNVKTAVVTAPSNMSFYITDINTCNIFFKLSFKGPNDDKITDLINSKAPKEYAKDYRLTLRILKPDGMRIDNIPVELRDPDSDFLYVDLKPRQLDMLGTYTCELFIDSLVTGEDENGEEINLRDERNTTNSFTFTVIKSIFTDVDEVIEADPDYPLLADVYATKEYVNEYVIDTVKNMDILGYATRAYVNQLIASSGDVDLSDYVKDEELYAAVNKYLTSGDVKLELPEYIKHNELNKLLSNTLKNYVTNNMLDGYATDDEMKAYVTRRLADISYDGDGNVNIDLDGYATTEALNSALRNKADKEHTHEDLYITQEDFTNTIQDYVTKDQIPVIPEMPEIPESLPANGGHADTADSANKIGEYSICVCTKEQYDELALSNSIDTTTLYFVKEN